MTARILDAAYAQVGRPAAWPDPESGFAFRLFQSAHLPAPSAFAEPLRLADAQLLRRTPELAAFGYLIRETNPATQADWITAFERLMGREIFPSDRNSFIHIPIELLGIAFGVAACPGAKGDHRTWLAGAIQRGVIERRFLDRTAQVAAACAEWLVNPTQSEGRHRSTTQAVEDIATADLIFFNSLALVVPERGIVDPASADGELLKRALSGPVPSRDAAEAAGVYVSLARAVERLVTSPAPGADPMATVVALCRRFQLLVDRLQARQRSRQSLTVADEYDVQDLLHAILKLHFDDVRPEEWTPSYAGNASRIDFLLPRERMIIEAKMTRQSLGQKEVANELIVDVARYAKFPNVDSLICLIYDPARRCTNPAALEGDLGNSEGRLRVVAVVCPRGT